MCFPLGDLFHAKNFQRRADWNNFDDDKNDIFSNQAINTELVLFRILRQQSEPLEYDYDGFVLAIPHDLIFLHNQHN